MNARAQAPVTTPEWLRRRRDFLRAQGGRKAVRQGFVLTACKRRAPDDGAARAGLTVSRKVGGAVQRNRVRRRLREIVRQVAPQRARPGYDYVVIARAAALTLGFEQLRRDMETAFRSVHAAPRPRKTDRPDAERNGGERSGADRP